MSLSPLTNQHQTSPNAATVTESTLPISGLRIVLTERGSRQTLEIDDSQGSLLTVISDSLLDPTVLRGGWRGVRDGQPWALVVGRSVSTPVGVTFTNKRFHLPGRAATIDLAEVSPQWIGDFWLAEEATGASRVRVSVAGVPAGTATLELVS